MKNQNNNSVTIKVSTEDWNRTVLCCACSGIEMAIGEMRYVGQGSSDDDWVCPECDDQLFSIDPDDTPLEDIEDPKVSAKDVAKELDNAITYFNHEYENPTHSKLFDALGTEGIKTKSMHTGDGLRIAKEIVEDVIKGIKMVWKISYTFETVPETTYWRNRKSGAIYHCYVQRNTWIKCADLCDDGTPLFEDGGYDIDTKKRNINISSTNLKCEKNLYYTWDELNAKFECLGECGSEEFYIEYLSNKSLYREFRFCLDSLPRLKRMVEREPDCKDWVVDLDQRIACVNAYRNLETFKYDYGF